MSKITVKFYLNNTALFQKKVDASEKLSVIHDLYKSNIPSDAKFLSSDGCEIDASDESDFSISDIMSDVIVYMNSKTYPNKNITPKIVKKNIPIQGSKLIGNKNGLDLYLYPEKKFTPEQVQKAIKIMVVGQTGSGKTTLLNSFINYLLGIKFEDNFRYKIINEDLDHPFRNNQISEIKTYYIEEHNGCPPIMIINTPGFVDTGDINEDIAIANKIENFIIDSLSEINAICFVWKSHSARMTIYHKYVLNSIFNLFGDDVKENYIFMLTFCDGMQPQVVEVLKSDELVFNEIIPYIELPWYYQFNNSGMFESGENNPFAHAFFDIGMKSFEDFTKRIFKLKPKSLDKSKEVIKQRHILEKRISFLHESLTKGLNLIDEIKILINNIKSLNGELNDNKNKNNVNGKEIIFEVLKNKYNDSIRTISQKTQIIQGLKKELININKEFLNTQDLITKDINRLKEVALNKSVFGIFEANIELLIEYERVGRREGYKGRIKGLEMLLKQRQIIKEVLEKKNKAFNDIINFINQI